MSEPKVTVTNGIGSNHIVNNQPPVQTIKAYESPAVKVVVPPDTQVKSESHISFEKQSVAEAEVPASASPVVEEHKATSAERRDAMKRANAEHTKAIQMQKEAKEMLAKSQRFQEVSSKAQQSPVELAKALGMDPTEFLRRYQNEMFNIPNEEAPKPEPTIDERLKHYEAERAQEKQAAIQYQSEMTRLNYINTKILPTIKADSDKFQLLNYNNIESSAGFIYDMMNDHYQKTGEELSANDVAEEMENQLQKEFEEKIFNVRKIGKFAKYFREEELAAEVATEPVSTASNQLGGTKTWSGAKSPVPVSGKKDRFARLNKLKSM